MGKQKRIRRGILAKCAGCGSYRGVNGMVFRQLPTGPVWHCGACWGEIVVAAERDACTVMRELIARYCARR